MVANSIGNCYICGAEISKLAAKTHLLKHYGEKKGGIGCSLLKVEGMYNKNYWLYIDVPVEETLWEVDRFLRHIWLECCDHMSAFFLPKRLELDMDRRLRTFQVGSKFSHHYDFGSTTETAITIMGTMRRKPQEGSVILLARNAPQVYKCADCGKTAEYFDKELMYQSDNMFYCAECRKKYEDGRILPITNSPRMGECGYGGENDTFAFDPNSLLPAEEIFL
jgi:DNA-directed RNA polymerase subunit RPC12/RpoP